MNDKLCRFLFFLDALRDASAARVTAIAPYLCYSRKAQRSRERDPVTTCYVAALVEAVGVKGIETMDVHKLAAFQNAFASALQTSRRDPSWRDILLQRCATRT